MTPKSKFWGVMSVWEPVCLILLLAADYLIARPMLDRAWKDGHGLLEKRYWMRGVIVVATIAAVVRFLAEFHERTIQSWPRTIMYAFAAVFGFVALAADPLHSWRHNSWVSPSNGCINNLRLIDSCKQMWAFEHHASLHSVPASSDLVPYLGRNSTGMLPFCPVADTTNFDACYTIGAVNQKPTCKISPSLHVLP